MCLLVGIMRCCIGAMWLSVANCDIHPDLGKEELQGFLKGRNKTEKALRLLTTLKKPRAETTVAGARVFPISIPVRKALAGKTRLPTSLPHTRYIPSHTEM